MAIIKTEENDFFTSNRSMCGHSHILMKQQLKITAKSKFFAPRKIDNWSSLPNYIGNVPMLTNPAQIGQRTINSKFYFFAFIAY